MHPGDAVCFLNSLGRISSDVNSSEGLEERFREEILREVEAMERVVRKNLGNTP